MLVRTTRPSDDVAQSVRAEVQNLDPDVSLEDFNTLKANVAFDRDRMDTSERSRSLRG